MKIESIDTSPKAPEAMPRALKILIWIAIVTILIALILPPVLMGHSPLPIVMNFLVLAMAVAVPIWLASKRLAFMAVWLVTYGIVYGALSWRGGYLGGNFGGNDNRDIWYPEYCGEVHQSPMGRQNCSLRPLGWFFLPLILADRVIHHPTRLDAD